LFHNSTGGVNLGELRLGKEAGTPSPRRAIVELFGPGPNKSTSADSTTVPVPRDRPSLAMRIGGCLALAWAVVLLLGWSLVTAAACDFQTSNCAMGQAKTTVYSGTLKAADGTVRRDTSFTVKFGSRLDEPRVGPFTTDAAGRYCFVWAAERILPFLYVGGTSVVEGTPSFRPLDGAAPPPSCQTSDATIPWNRTDDALDSWQFAVIPTILLPAIVLLVLALFAGTAAIAGRLVAIGAPVLAAGTVLAPIIW
jgi:hypothetical protein